MEESGERIDDPVYSLLGDGLDIDACVVVLENDDPEDFIEGLVSEKFLGISDCRVFEVVETDGILPNTGTLLLLLVG